MGVPVLPERRARLRKKWELLFVCKSWVVSIYVQENCVCDSLTRSPCV